MGRMSNPHDEQPQAQPSPQTPYQPSGQYQPGGQPMPYGQPYGAPPQEHPQGTLILVFGILGIFITIFAPIAWYMGNKAKREIQASGIQYSNEHPGQSLYDHCPDIHCSDDHHHDHCCRRRSKPERRVSGGTASAASVGKSPPPC